MDNTQKFCMQCLMKLWIVSLQRGGEYIFGYYEEEMHYI